MPLEVIVSGQTDFSAERDKRKALVSQKPFITQKNVSLKKEMF